MEGEAFLVSNERSIHNFDGCASRPQVQFQCHQSPDKRNQSHSFQRSLGNAWRKGCRTRMAIFARRSSCRMNVGSKISTPVTTRPDVHFLSFQSNGKGAQPHSLERRLRRACCQGCILQIPWPRRHFPSRKNVGCPDLSASHFWHNASHFWHKASQFTVIFQNRFFHTLLVSQLTFSH